MFLNDSRAVSFYRVKFIKAQSVYSIPFTIHSLPKSFNKQMPCSEKIIIFMFISSIFTKSQEEAI